MTRTCKRCGSINFDIWGSIGLIGFSLIVGSMGYALALFGFRPNIILLGVVFGTCLMGPMRMISFHEQREQRKREVRLAEVEGRM